MTSLYTIHKKQMIRSFNRAVSCYDEAATLQRTTARQLLNLLYEYSILTSDASDKKLRVLELGTGTGYLTQLLLKTIPHSVLLAIDIAEQMIARTRQVLMQEDLMSSQSYACVCADADDLPIIHESFNIVISNLCLQWSQNLSTTIREYARVLNRQGWLLLTTLGPKTLVELRTCWGRLDDQVHVNQFLSKEVIKDHLLAAGFELYQLSSHDMQQYYSNVIMLMRQLKSLGARNWNQGRPKNLMGKRKFQQLLINYEQQYAINSSSSLNQLSQLSVPASYEVIYIVAKKRNNHGED